MYQTINETDFVTAFADMGRADNFSVAARRRLFDWFEDLEDGIGEAIEFDPIAICCDWSEMTLEELRREYPDQCGEAEDLDECAEALGDETSVIHVSDEDTLLVEAF